jgi:hypothetical protein
MDWEKSIRLSCTFYPKNFENTTLGTRHNIREITVNTAFLVLSNSWFAIIISLKALEVYYLLLAASLSKLQVVT